MDVPGSRQGAGHHILSAEVLDYSMADLLSIIYISYI